MRNCFVLFLGLITVVSFGGVADAAETEAEMAARVSPGSLDPVVVEDFETDGLTVTIFPQSSEGDSNLKWATADSLVTDPTRPEAKPSIASAPNGELYAAVETLSDNLVRIYRSLDGGESWSFFIGVSTGGVDCRNPALAYVENSGDRWVILVYEVVFSDILRGLNSIHVNADNTSDWAAAWIDDSIPWIGATRELHPQITTDFPDFSSSVYYYVTYATPSIDYYPVFFSRSTDQGATWSAPLNITGGSENTAFESRPEIAYSAHRNDVYVAFTKPGWTGSEWAPQIWVTNNTLSGGSSYWQTPVQVSTSSFDEMNPSVAAAWDSNTVMVAWTRVWSADNDVYYSYSTDGGAVWSSGNALPSWTFDDEDSVDLAASQAASGRFHAAYRHEDPAMAGSDIWYSWANVSSPGSWSSALDVDEGSVTSGLSFYPRPAICVDLSQAPADEAALLWTTYTPGYRVFFDSAMSTDLIFSDGFESGNVSAWSSSVP